MPLTIGPMHHMSLAVQDVEAAAKSYEATFGWERTMDMEMSPSDAAKVGAVLGIGRLDWARAIVMADPGSRVGMVELLQMRQDDAELQARLPTGLLAMSYRVADADAAVAELTAGGFELVCAPQEMYAAGNIRMATVRGPHAGLIEVVQFLGR